MLKIECDLDATLADIYTPAEKYIWNEGYPDFRFTQVKTYEGKHGGIACPRVVRLKWLTEPIIYKTAELYPGVNKAIGYLMKNKDIYFHINSSTDEKCVVAKERFIRDKFKPLVNHPDRFGYTLDIGFEKRMLDMDVIIEDCLENIRKSNSRLKIIIDRSHNVEKYNPTYQDVFDTSYRVKDMVEAVKVIKKTFPEYFQ